MTVEADADIAPERIEGTIREYLAHPYADAPGRAAFYALDSVCFDPVGHPAIVGRAAIEAKFADTVRRGLSSRVEIKRLITAGNKAAADISADVFKGGELAFACEGMMIFEFDGELLIKRMEVFIAS